VVAVAWTASGQNYLPLDVGNQWVYRSGTQTAVAEVVSASSYGGVTYSQVRGLPGMAGAAWLRADESGRLWAWDGANAQAVLWLDLAAAAGTTSDTTVNPCTTKSQIETRAGDFLGAVGQFNTAVIVSYHGGACADAGLESDSWLDWVGLLRRSETTIAGPRSWELVYARLGASTLITAQELSFTLSLDKSVYTANMMPPISRSLIVPVMLARLTLRNTSDDALDLVFASGQEFELLIRNEKGDEVYRWSDGQMFIQIVRTVKLDKGERNWAVPVRLRVKGSEDPLPAGRYTAEAWVTASNSRHFAGVVGFEIRVLN
jgi:hypothetical protein